MSARMSLADALARTPRIALVDAPTPIQPLKRIEEAMGPALNGVNLYVKRDDLMGLGGGGNKLRKLEYLMGDAAANGCDTVIASGGIQSNFTRVAAAACARERVACELVLAPLVPETDDEYQSNGNTILNDLFGARVHVLGRGEAAADFAKRRAEELTAQGRRPYLTPGGGSNSISALGYVRCALELDTQLNSSGLDDAIIVTANGSSGTHAGLLAGFRALGRSPHQLRAFTVLANAENSRNSTLTMANGSLELLGASDRLGLDDVQIADDQRGRGYGIVTDAMIEAVRLMASCEGLILDPVYSGKAFAGLIGDVRSGRYPAGSSVVFLMTGGAPALFAYRSAFARKDGRS
jgi:D-cysteine desulfhydrase family pyridoxal phosphate-dependent enzyme